MKITNLLKAKKLLAVCIVCTVLLCFSLSSAEDTRPPFLTFEPLTTLTIACGDGLVEISFKTGAATFTDCKPNEAAKVFYEAFQGYFKEQKTKWCEQNK